MYWFYILIVAPLWGTISAQLLMISGLSLINSFIGVIGFFRRKTDFFNLAAATAVPFLNCILFAALLAGGSYLIQQYTSFGSTKSENVTFWIFAVFSAWGSADEFYGNIQKQWRHCMVEGAIEKAALDREVAALNRQEKSKTESSAPSAYKVIFSDGTTQENKLMPYEIESWPIASNELFEKEARPYRIVRIADNNGTTVWPTEQKS
jgi:hypothetical protein